MADTCLRTVRSRVTYCDPPYLRDQLGWRTIAEVTLCARWCAALLKDLPALGDSKIAKGEVAFERLRQEYEGVYAAVQGYLQFIFIPALNKASQHRGEWSDLQRRIYDVEDQLQEFAERSPMAKSEKLERMSSRSPWVCSHLSRVTDSTPECCLKSFPSHQVARPVHSGQDLRPHTNKLY